MSRCLFNVYMDIMTKEVKLGAGSMEVRFLEREGGDAEDLVLCGESEKDLKEMVVRFVEVCRRRSLKFNANKSKVMVLSGKEGLGLDTIGVSIRIQIFGVCFK